MDKFSELKAAAMAATPGPWFVHEKPCEDGNYGIDTSDNEWTAEAVVWWGFARQSIWKEEDARFIAAANPAAVLELLAELEATRKQSQELAKQCVRLGARAAIAERKLATPVRLVAYRNSPDMHTKQYYEAIGFNQGIDACSVAVRAAGFKVEGDDA